MTVGLGSRHLFCHLRRAPRSHHSTAHSASWHHSLRTCSARAAALPHCALMVVPGGLKRSVYCELRGGAATISAVACKRGRVLLFAQRVANRRRALLGEIANTGHVAVERGVADASAEWTRGRKGGLKRFCVNNSNVCEHSGFLGCYIKKKTFAKALARFCRDFCREAS